MCLFLCSICRWSCVNSAVFPPGTRVTLLWASSWDPPPVWRDSTSDPWVYACTTRVASCLHATKPQHEDDWLLWRGPRHQTWWGLGGRSLGCLWIHFSWTQFVFFHIDEKWKSTTQSVKWGLTAGAHIYSYFLVSGHFQILVLTAWGYGTFSSLHG